MLIRSSQPAFVWSLSFLLGALGLAGCTRNYYRESADREVYNLVAAEPYDPVAEPDGFNIHMDNRSRFYDPNPPDRPPMPPDDLTSHQLMNEVAGMRGYKCWGKWGYTPYIENPDWQQYLPYDEEGNIRLDLVASIELARRNSPDFQTELEDLYLSALDVTFERFRFDTQYFAGNVTTALFRGRDRAGGSSSSRLTNNVPVQANTFFASGAQSVVGFANTLVWDFASNDMYAGSSLLNFTFVQPLLREGSRARVLERLTIAERALLANTRQMIRYQHGFVTEVATGVNSGPGPQRRGGFFGGVGLEGFTGVGTGGFGQVGGFGGGGQAGGAGAGQAGGFIGRLQTMQQIRNQEVNVVALRESLAQLQALNDANRIDRFQVDQARQALYNAQSVLLTSRVSFQDSLDDYKRTLGLPPHLTIALDDSIIQPFQLLDPRLTNIRNDVTNVLDRLRNPTMALNLTYLQAQVQQINALRDRVRQHIEVINNDMMELESKLDARRDALRVLLKRKEFVTGEFDPQPFRPENLDARVQKLREDWNKDLRSLQQAEVALMRVIDALPRTQPVDTQAALTKATTDFSVVLLELALDQARARVEILDLPPLGLTSQDAFAIASINRLDWMNARAALVDSWRLIEFNANELESTLNVVINGDLGTNHDNPFRFRGSNGALQMGVEFDAPITRLAERNQYRQSLIDYQRARRQYLNFVDSVNQSLRSTVRTMNRNRVNFELRRAAIGVAVNQVYITQERLNEPPRPAAPGEVRQQTTSPTLARDLLSALSDLLQVQNDFLSVWINDQVLRMVLDRDLGTMKLDERGLWIDPGSFDHYRDLYMNCLESESVLSEDLPPLPPNMPLLPDPNQDPRSQDNLPEPKK